MSEWTDDDIYNDAEAEEDRKRSKDLRRAILGGIAGVALLVGPIVLANAFVSDDDAEVEASERQPVAALKQKDETTTTVPTTVAPPVTEVPVTAPPVTEPPVTAPPVLETPPTTAAPAYEPPAPVEPPPSNEGGLGDPYDYATWDALAECESGGNWSINTGNGYYGGLQFSLSSWRGVGGEGYPHENSRETQIAMGQRLYESGGWGHWPACSRKLGLR